MSLVQVVAATADGGTYSFIPPNVSNASGGNGGSVARASSTDTLDGVEVARYDAGVFGSTVIETTNVTNAGGTLAYNNQSPVAKRLSSKINGSSNDVLLSGAAQPQLIEGIHKSRICTMGCTEGVRTTKTTSAVRGGAFNLYTGKFASGYPEHSDDYFVGIDYYNSGSIDNIGDHAAQPTRAVPGTLTYRYGSPNTVTQNYSEKTG